MSIELESDGWHLYELWMEGWREGAASQGTKPLTLRSPALNRQSCEDEVAVSFCMETLPERFHIHGWGMATL